MEKLKCSDCYFERTCVSKVKVPSRPSYPEDENSCNSYTTDDDMRRADYAEKNQKRLSFRG